LKRRDLVQAEPDEQGNCNKWDKEFYKSDRGPHRVLQSKTYESDVRGENTVEFSNLVWQEKDSGEQQRDRDHPLRIAEQRVDLIARGEIGNDGMSAQGISPVGNQ
jgi:hypothetical protein